MNYLSVEGNGNPNTEGGEYQKTLEILYPLAFTIKMSYKGDHRIDGFFEYVVPPLEGFWWQEGIDGMDYGKKELFRFLSVIRLPDFVKKEDFDWAVAEVERKKKMDCRKAQFLTISEGLCVQCMHLGPYDDEPATVALMDQFLKENGYENDMTEIRKHHEIYLSDARKSKPGNLKTVIRHPIKKAEK